jgi:nucleoside-diphosphate-sugar epimerase
MKKKTIAVIGANSFLATYVIRELVQHEYQLRLYGRRALQPTDAATFTVFDYPNNPLNFEDLLTVDTIIYTAGAGIQSNVPTSNDLIYHVNAFLPINLIQYLQDKEYKGHVITFGSYFEIGNSLIEKFYTEEEYITNNNTVPNNYCISKRLLSQYISQKVNGLDFYLTHFVLPNIYGVGENTTRIIPYLVESIKNKKPIHLSSGTQKRQFLHARDAASIIQKVVDEPKSGIYNLGDSNVLSIKDVVHMVVDEVPDKEGLDINFGTITKRDVGMQFLALDPNKVERELNWKASISLVEGIREYF